MHPRIPVPSCIVSLTRNKLSSLLACMSGYRAGAKVGVSVGLGFSISTCSICTTAALSASRASTVLSLCLREAF